MPTLILRVHLPVDASELPAVTAIWTRRAELAWICRNERFEWSQLASGLCELVHDELGGVILGTDGRLTYAGTIAESSPSGVTVTDEPDVE